MMLILISTFAFKSTFCDGFSLGQLRDIVATETSAPIAALEVRNENERGQT